MKAEAGSPEMDLLLRSIRAGLRTDGVHPDLAAIEEDVCWDRFLALASVHGVTPLINRAFKMLPNPNPLGITDRARDTLTSRTKTIAMRNLGLSHELASVISICSAHGIRAIPFKGPVLAATAYANIRLRQFGDLDILVHPADIRSAVDVLEERGYRWDGGPRLDDSAVLGGPITKPLVSEYGLTRDGLEIEVRWRVGDSGRPFTPTVEQLWSRRQTVRIVGEDLPTLAPADRLLMLSFHGTKHRWHQLKWVCDFGAALGHHESSLPEALERAQRHGHRRKLLAGVDIAHVLLGIEVPDAVQAALQDESIRHLTQPVIDDLVEGQTKRPSWRKKLQHNVQASDSTRNSLRMLALQAPLHPSAPDYRLLPLPGSLHLIYYLVRPLRLLSERIPHPTSRRKADDHPRYRATTHAEFEQRREADG